MNPKIQKMSAKLLRSRKFAVIGLVILGVLLLAALGRIPVSDAAELLRWLVATALSYLLPETSDRVV